MYILQNVSPNPTDTELITVCNDMLTIFPKLKFPNSVVGGMVRVCSLNRWELLKKELF